MCLIIDNCVASIVFLPSKETNFKCVRTALFGKKKPLAVAVYGGQLLAEYPASVLDVLEELERSGRARFVATELIDKELDIVTQTGQCTSNDVHIVALARAGSVRLLCTDDDALARDFRNKALLDHPRGSVYRPRGRTNTQTHCKKLLKRCCS